MWRLECGREGRRWMWAWVWVLFSSLLFLPHPAAPRSDPPTPSPPRRPHNPAKEDDWGTLVAVTAVRGSTARLPCHIRSPNPEEPVLLVLWYKNASVTPVYSYDSRGLEGRAESEGRPQQWGDEQAWGSGQRAWFDTSHSPAQLLVRDVRGRDEGSYRCKVHFKASPSWSQRITLSVKDPPGYPRIQDESGQRLEGPIGPYEDGTTVRMMCLSSGEPPPGLVWGGSGAGRGSGVQRDDSTARTRLSIVASRDSAHTTVTCSTVNASSPNPIHTVSTTLRVNLPPLEVRLEAPGEWVSAGQQSAFKCRVVGSSPEPVVQWWLGGRQLIPSTPPVSEGVNVSVSEVRLTLEPGDHGVPLVCKAFSPALPGTVLHDQLSLAVHFLPVATSSVEGGGTLADVREGGSIAFICSVKANPDVYNITWYHNGRPLKGREKGVRMADSKLQLLNVSADMRGLYTCVGSNQEGDGQSNALNLNVQFAPVCAAGQRREYVVGRGGSVTIGCSVQAHPSTLTFTWAVKSAPDGPPVRLHSVGREEGLTGHYTLTRLPEGRAEVLCWARNAIGSQEAPCRFIVYTQGRPAPLSRCKVGNHTASGFTVLCGSGPSRISTSTSTTSTRYTLLVYAQDPNAAAGGGGGGGGGDAGGGGPTAAAGRGGGGEGGGKEGMASPGGGGVSADKAGHSALGQLVRNMTSHIPAFKVSGLQAGQEFAVVVQASNREGSSSPTFLSAFTLRDNAQTVIGVSSGGEGRTNKGGGVGGTGGSSSSSSSSSSSTSGSSGGSGDGPEGGWSEGGGGAGGVGGGWVFVPPMMLVLAGSLSSILLLALIIIVIIKRRGRRSQRVERQLEQVKLSGEALVPPPSPQEAPRRTPGSRRKHHGTRGDGVMDEGSCAGSVCGSGSSETVLDGGGDEGEMVCGTTVTAEVEMTGGGEGTTAGGDGKEGEARLAGGAPATAGTPRVGGAAAGGIMISGVGLFDNSGACNGGLLPSASTASPMDLLTGTLQEGGVGVDSAPLPLLGVSRLGRGAARQQQVLLQEVPVLGVGGLVGGGLDLSHGAGVGTINMGVAGMPRMMGVNMGGFLGAGVGNPCMGAGTMRAVGSMGAVGGMRAMGSLGAMGGMGAVRGMGPVGRLEAGSGGNYLVVSTPGLPSSSSSSPVPAPIHYQTQSPAGRVRQNMEDTSFTHPNESMSSL